MYLRIYLCSPGVEVKAYVVPVPGEGTDELDHYRLQVKVMADLINVSQSLRLDN